MRPSKFYFIFIWIILILLNFYTEIQAQSFDVAQSNAAVLALALKADGWTFKNEDYGTLYAGESTTRYTNLYYGLQYAFTVTGDDQAIDIDIKIYDQYYNLIISDTRSNKEAIVEFSPSFTGTYYIKIEMHSASGLAYWYLVSGYK
jgi:hypothetical protein